MKTEKIVNKEGEVYKTKEGVEMTKSTLEVGDEFIPLWSKPIKNEAKSDDQFDSYKIKAKVRDAETKAQYSVDGEEEIYLDLTKTQYESLMNRANGYTTKEGKVIDPIELTQNIFVTYEYESKSVKGKMCVGVGVKSNRPEPKSFEDFEEKEE